MMVSIGYDPNSSILEIEFNEDVVWEYFDFPENLWFEFEESESKGKFFHREIKDKYRGARVG